MAGILLRMPQHRNKKARRSRYAIQIRTQQSQQEQFAFIEREVQSEFRRSEGISAEFGLQPVKDGQQQVAKHAEPVKSNVQPLTDERKRGIVSESIVAEIVGEQPSSDGSRRDPPVGGRARCTSGVRAGHGRG
jgi:hypothetical protein